MNFLTKNHDGVPAVQDARWQDIIDEAGKHRRSKITVESFSEERAWSDQQRRWWKGCLLPSLEKSTGDSIQYWETLLKLAVLPDDFKPVKTVVDGVEYTYVPSIKDLSMTKMNIMVTGSVDHLRDESIYGDYFSWVVEPRRELRK